ncbi:MAG TPA: hypothetical protein DDW65_23295 [Firmicutes bacterium]|nr:hypothetical protein [Bacillota bacterium]
MDPINWRNMGRHLDSIYITGLQTVGIGCHG